MRFGAHVRSADPLAAARDRGADCVQVFLSNPQSWRKPAPREDAEALRASEIDLYVHAPYLVNVASPNNKIRIPSRKILQDTCDAAAAVGATAVIVHGGHVDADTDVAEGFTNWRKAIERVETDVPVLIENTAGGQHAMARHFDTIARLWEALDGLDVGFCLDTCHAQAAGEDVAKAADRILSITGRIDLVHVNDSKDEPGSGRDRHENLGKGTIELAAIAEVIARSGAPAALVETPGDAEQHANEIAFLRQCLAETAGT